MVLRRIEADWEGTNLSEIYVRPSGTAGPPTTGTWKIGHLSMDMLGRLWRCTIAGTPGTWELFASDVESVKKSFNTASPHGFSVGDCLRVAGIGLWAQAVSNTAATSEVVGVIESVPSTTSFVLVFKGYITGLSGLTAGVVYFLSDTAPGLFTATEPTTFGYVSKPVIKALSPTTAIVEIFRGHIITNGILDSSALSYNAEIPGLWSSPLPTLISSAIDQLIKYVHQIGDPIFTLRNSLPTSGQFMWLMGQQLLKVTYPTLYSAYGHDYEDPLRGGTPVSDTDLYFRMPDMRGVVPGSVDSYDGGATNRGILTFASHNLQGRFYGEEAHALNSAENGPHSHNYARENTVIVMAGGGNNVADGSTTSTATSSSGSGTPHNNMQPTILGRWYTRY